MVGDCSHHCTNTAHQHRSSTPVPPKMAPRDLHLTRESILRVLHLALRSEIIHRPYSGYHRLYKLCFEPDQAAAHKSQDYKESNLVALPDLFLRALMTRSFHCYQCQGYCLCCIVYCFVLQSQTACGELGGPLQLGLMSRESLVT